MVRQVLFLVQHTTEVLHELATQVPLLVTQVPPSWPRRCRPPGHAGAALSHAGAALLATQVPPSWPRRCRPPGHTGAALLATQVPPSWPRRCPGRGAPLYSEQWGSQHAGRLLSLTRPPSPCPHPPQHPCPRCPCAAAAAGGAAARERGWGRQWQWQWQVGMSKALRVGGD